jgi:co-chaperonin GroES (HSP10)
VNESSEKKEQVLKQHLDMAHTIRMKAAQKSNDADKKTIKRQSSKFPHSVYAIGDRVLVKTNKKKWNKVKGKGVATKRSSKATVVAVNPAYNKYKVKMDNTPTEIWVSVSLITSLTREKENKRMKVSGMLNYDCMYTYLFHNWIG